MKFFKCHIDKLKGHVFFIAGNDTKLKKLVPEIEFRSLGVSHGCRYVHYTKGWENDIALFAISSADEVVIAYDDEIFEVSKTVKGDYRVAPISRTPNNWKYREST